MFVKSPHEPLDRVVIFPGDGEGEGDGGEVVAEGAEKEGANDDQDRKRVIGADASVLSNISGTMRNLHREVGGGGEDGENPYFEWKEWRDEVPTFKYNGGTKFFNLVVATVDTVKYDSLLRTMCFMDQPVLVTGSSGCGKNVLIESCLKSLGRDKNAGGQDVLPIMFAYSSHTSSKFAQHTLEKKLSRKRKDLLGAPVGKKHVLFIDDVNLPAPEKFGAQPVVEFTRQLLDRGGFYDREKLFWVSVERCLCVCAAAPPGGGRHELGMRMLRHFSIFCLPTQGVENIQTIFSSILGGFFKNFGDQILR